MSPRARRRAFAVILIAAALSMGAALRRTQLLREWQDVQRSYHDARVHTTDVEIETIATGLHTIWDIEFTGPDRALASERGGRIRLIDHGRLDPTPYHVFEDASPGQHLGVLDMLPDPDYATNKYLYVSYTPKRAELVPIQDPRYMRQTYNYGTTLVIMRFVDTGQGLSQGEKIFQGEQGDLDVEPGGRMTFGPDGKLYVMHGNFAHQNFDAQNLRTLKGKILRLNRDGSIPSDNPYVGRSDARAEIYSKGHKNSTGLLFVPRSDELLEVSHGPTGSHFRPTGYDEINVIRPAGDYGWPVVFGTWNLDGMTPPVYLWREQPSMAPGGAVFYDGDAFPQWKGNLLVTGLASKSLLRFSVDHDRVGLEEKVIAGDEEPLKRLLGLRSLTGIGRLRGIAVGRDGLVYVGTSNAENADDPDVPIDRIVRIRPRS
jgi:glucose/arabinose dehydrogenase